MYARCECCPQCVAFLNAYIQPIFVNAQNKASISDSGVNKGFIELFPIYLNSVIQSTLELKERSLREAFSR